MSSEIPGRPVLRSAGNTIVRLTHSTEVPPAPAFKPPSLFAPLLKLPQLPSEFSPPNSPSKYVLKPSVYNPQPKLPPSARKFCYITNRVSRSSNFHPDIISIPKSQSSEVSLTCYPHFVRHAEATSDPLLPNSAAFSCTPDLATPLFSDVSPLMSKGQITEAPSKKTSTKSSSGNLFQKTSTNVPTKSGLSISKLGSLSLDETSLALTAAKKAANMELHTQKKLRIAEYGRIKQGKASRVVPETVNLPIAPVELKRCKFITSQSDPVYVAYHDEEWGVPVHNDRLLFELLVLVGAQVELSWPTILRRRSAYRSAFAGFEPDVVARFNDKQIGTVEADTNLMLHRGKIRGVVENAQRILEIVEEYGSFEMYLWNFVNGKPMINNYRYARQVPVKTSKSEWISKELVRRGFRFVGPTIMYSFMQATGMCNDHLVECFRHDQCC